MIGGHHEPWRVVGAAGVDCVFVGMLIVVPEGALAIIRLVDLPMSRRILQAFFETLELLVGTDMEEEFEDMHIVVTKITLKGIDAVVTRPPHLFRHQIVDPRH